MQERLFFLNTHRPRFRSSLSTVRTHDQGESNVTVGHHAATCVTINTKTSVQVTRGIRNNRRSGTIDKTRATSAIRLKFGIGRIVQRPTPAKTTTPAATRRVVKTIRALRGNDSQRA
jgi:hypothetical protein